MGGGPAGAAAALALGRAAISPLLVERTTVAHDPVCGGFLGWDAIASLNALGVDPWELGARPITRVRIFAGGSLAEAPLPRRAAGLSRRTLDAALLAAAAGAGAEIRRGVAVRRADQDGVHLAGGETLTPDTLFLATGKHELRGLSRITSRATRVGLRASLPGVPELDGVIELYLVEGGYVGLLVQEDGCTNLCLSIARERLNAAGGTPDSLLTALIIECPLLGERLSGTPGAWSAVAAVPYGWRTATTDRGCFRLGDQAAVVASLAGDGIAIALASGRAAAAAWLAGGEASAALYQRDFARRAALPIGIAESFRFAAERPALARPLVALLAKTPAMLGLGSRFTRIGA